MTETRNDTIVPVPLLDRTRVAEAIRRGVRLDIDPVIAKAAVHGMAVELTEQQSLAIADCALEALANAQGVSAGEWLAKANRDWRGRAENAELRRRALVGLARRELMWWRRAAVTAWFYFGNVTAQLELHWPRWSALPALPLLVGAVLFFERRSRRRADAADGALKAKAGDAS